MIKHYIKGIFTVLIVLCCFFTLQAQDISVNNNQGTSNELPEVSLGEMSVFEYQDTPDYVFIKRRNFFKTLNELQLEILETYNYPKFISSNSGEQIELDIKLHWERVKVWEIENEENIEEILSAMGLHK